MKELLSIVTGVYGTIHKDRGRPEVALAWLMAAG